MTQIKPNGGELIPCSAAVTQLLFFLYLAAAVASLGALHCLEPCCFAEPGSGYVSKSYPQLQLNVFHRIGVSFGVIKAICSNDLSHYSF